MADDNMNFGKTALGVLATQFWKLLAVVVLSLVVFTVHERWNFGDMFRFDATVNNSTHRDRTKSDRYSFFTWYGTDLQSKPAIVVLKNGAGTVEGFYHSADAEFLLLITVHKEKSETVRVLIPWENVLYIRTTGVDKPDTKKQP